MSLSRPSYFQRVNADANAANDALGTAITKGGTALATGTLSRGVFGTSGVTPFQTWFEGAGAISTDFGTLSGFARIGAALGVRVGAGAAVYSSWRVGNYLGAAVGNIPLPGGPTITDAVSSFIQYEAEGPDTSEPPSCTP